MNTCASLIERRRQASLGTWFETEGWKLYLPQVAA
jgi:hypothetical protein